MAPFNEDDLLLLSGIQHMAFCPRQWALIHIEQVWAENVLTVEGRHLHECTDDPFGDEIRKDLRIVRAMPIVSWNLGLRGVADVVEFYQKKCQVEGLTCRLSGRSGWWRPIPVEYKRGRPKKDDRDAVQLCAQAMAIEEMMQITIDFGYLFYGQTRKRQKISFGPALRLRTIELADCMHQLFRENVTPKAQKGKHCSQCSLIEQCHPELTLHHRSVKNYLKKMCYVKEDKH